MAAHSSVLAWEILWTEEPGGLQSMESQRVRHNLMTKWQQPQNAKITAWFIRNNYCQIPSLFVILYQLTTQKVLESSLLATQQCITWAKLNSKEQKWKYLSPIGFSLSLFLNQSGKKWKWQSLSVTPRTITHQALLSMEFSRQGYWSELPCPPAGDLPNPGMKPGSPELQADSLPFEPPGKPSEGQKWKYLSSIVLSLSLLKIKFFNNYLPKPISSW